MDITLDPTRVLHLTSVQHPPKKSQEKPITKENCFFVQIFWNFLQRSGEIFVFKNEFGERERRNNVGVWEWPQMVQICPTTKKHVFFFVLCNLPLFLLWIKKWKYDPDMSQSSKRIIGLMVYCQSNMTPFNGSIFTLCLDPQSLGTIRPLRWPLQNSLWRSRWRGQWPNNIEGLVLEHKVRNR